MPDPAILSGWDRAVAAVEAVRKRLLRTVESLERAGIPYGVIGAHAVAEWVSRVDESAIRNTPNVDVLIDRSDFEATTAALQAAGFTYRLAGLHSFIEGLTGKERNGVHVLFAGEKVKEEDLLPAPCLAQTEDVGDFRVIGLEALVQMKLVSFRTIDRVHLRDMIDVGLIDATWPARLPPTLGTRLQALLDDPGG